MRNFIQKTFLDHPHSVDETFFQHFRFAMYFSGSLFVAAIAAMVHAIVPSMCKRTASRRIAELHNRMHNRLN